MKKFKFLFFVFILFSSGSLCQASSDFFDLKWNLDFDSGSVPNFFYAEDLNNDKKIELIISSQSKIIVYDNDGKFKWEEKINSITAVYVSDYTKKDEKDIIVGTQDGYVYVIDYSGRVKFRQDFSDLITSFFVSDVDGDGNKELLVGSRDKSVYVLSSERKIKWKFETEGSVISITAADIDGDRIKEVLAGSEWSSHDKLFGGIYAIKNSELEWSKQTDGSVSEIYFEGGKIIALVKYKSILVFDKEGNPDWKKENKFGYLDASDLEGDGNTEIIASSFPYVYAYDISGNEKWRYSVINSVTSLYVHDLHNDGMKEVMAGTEYGTTTMKSSDLYVISASGSVESVSMFEGRGRITTIAVNDIDKDNKKEVMLAFIAERIAGGEQHITDGSVKVLDLNEEYTGTKEKTENESVKKEEPVKKEDADITEKKDEKNETKKPPATPSEGQEKPADNTMLILIIAAAVILIISAAFLIIRNKGRKSDYAAKEKPEAHTPAKEEKETEKKTAEKETKETKPEISIEERTENPKTKE